MRILSATLLFLVLPGTWLLSQSNTLTLDEAIRLAKEHSIAAKRAATRKETAYWQWRTFLSELKPQLALNGNLPGFTRSFVEVVQPDGTIAFNPVSFNNSSLELSLSQQIAKTGGTIFLQHQLQRFDDFDRNNTLYNGIPFAIGYAQPLFRFNALKWGKQIEPLRYEESRQQFIASMEETSLNVSNYYFDLLLAQINRQIAQTNLANNDTLFQIAQERLALGKISQNDLLQLRLSVLDARKDLSSAQQQEEAALLQLNAFLGVREETAFQVNAPENIRILTINPEQALQQAFANRPDAIAFGRRMLEASQELDRAQKENGFNASLSLAFGLSNRGSRPSDVYRKPQDREFAEIQFTLPIMDWGRSRSRTETAKANLTLAQQTTDQDKITFRQEIITQIALFEMLQQQVQLSKEADQIASQRYQIAQDRFLLSDLSVTDLSIALQEKDGAKRDFILALRDYWRAYYSLRWLTLYDFEKNEKISY